MNFELRPLPLLPPYGGLDDEDPANFIATGEQGLRGTWHHHDEILIAVLEDFDAEVSADLCHAVVCRERRVATEGCSRAYYPAQASHGNLVFQRYGSGLIRVEYGIVVLRSEELDPRDCPHEDDEVETALRHWLQENEAEITAAIDERSGEMR